MIMSRYTLEDNYENLHSRWLVSGYRFELATLGTQHLETSANIIPLDTDTRKVDRKYFPFCFLDRTFSIMKTKNKPTKCTN